MVFEAGEPVATVGDDDLRGLVHPTEALLHLDLGRTAPCAGLAWSVDRYWHVRWSLSAPFEQRIVSHPAVHVTFEPDGAFVNGVVTGEWSRRLEGDGQVLGVKFRPAGFRPFLGRSVASITDQVLPLADVFGAVGAELATRAAPIIQGGTVDELVPLVEAWLGSLAVDGRERSEAVSGIVEESMADPRLGRVADLAARLGLTTRRLQRLFADHVGAPPKWVLDRARIHEVGERVRRDPELRWAELAAELGFADQAHLTRRFTETVGTSPARYAARVTSGRYPGSP